MKTFIRLTGLVWVASIVVPIAAHAQDSSAPKVQNLAVRYSHLGLDVIWTKQPGMFTEVRYRRSCGDGALYAWSRWPYIVDVNNPLGSRLHAGSSVSADLGRHFDGLSEPGSVCSYAFQARHITQSGQVGLWSASVFPQRTPSIEIARVIPHIAQGAGWETELQVVNNCYQSHPNDVMNCYDERYNILFTDANGTPMRFYVQGHGMVERLEGSVDEGVVTYHFPETDSLLVGGGVFTDTVVVDENGNFKNDSGHVVANTVYKYRGGDGVVHKASVPYMPFSEKTIRLPFKNSGGTKTALVIVRSGPAYNPVWGLCDVFWAYDASGETISSSNKLCIPEFKNNRAYKTTFLLDELERFREHDGVIEFRNIKSPVIAFALIFHADHSFTTQWPQIPFRLWGRCGSGCSFGAPP